MPLVTVTGGPTPPTGRTITAGTRLTVRYDEAYADGISTYPQTYEAEWDSSTGGWKPLGAANGTAFQIPAGADGYPRPPGAWLTEQQVLDNASEQVSRRGPMRIYESSAGEWAYATPAPTDVYVSSPSVPPPSAVLQSEVGAANGVAALDGAGDVPLPQIPDLSSLYAALAGATFAGPVILPAGPDVTLASTGNPLQIGGAGGENIAIDANEIQARNNGAAAILNLQAAGGTVHIGNAAVAAYGSNANGEYVRLYNGVQVCWTVQTLTYSAAAEMNKVWTFPAAFNANPKVIPIPANTGTDLSDAERGGSFLFVASVSTSSITLRMRSDSLYDGTEQHDTYAIAIGTW